MSHLSIAPDVQAWLNEARHQAQTRQAGSAAGLDPERAWALVKAGQAVLVDVRSNEERVFVGRIPDTLHVAWATGSSLTRNPRFVRELEAKVGDKHRLVLLLCRSGRRSALAAEAATQAGFTQTFHVLEGFEGELDAHGHRGTLGGWRQRGLPWLQD